VRVAAGIVPIGLVVLLGLAAADAATIVALGASNTYGEGVSHSEAYPAQLEALLRAQGHNIRVIAFPAHRPMASCALRKTSGG
jgi:acyl-CoA thioesterase I